MPGSNYPYSTGEYFDSPTLSTTPSILTGVLNNTLTPSFDPNAGKQAAYDQRWNNYLTNLGKTQNKINVKKARKYFDSQFELDWNNEAASRELDFASNLALQLQNDLISKFRAANEEAARLSKEQDAVDYKAAGYTYDEEKWNKPVIPPPSPKLTDWDAIAASKLGSGKTMNDVRDLQRKMLAKNLYIGTVDGKWGKKTLEAYDLYLKQLKSNNEEVPLFLAKPENSENLDSLKFNWNDLDLIGFNPPILNNDLKQSNSSKPKNPLYYYGEYPLNEDFMKVLSLWNS